jgi:hypothetical protein
MDVYTANLETCTLDPVDTNGSIVYCQTCLSFIGKIVLCDTSVCSWCGDNRTRKLYP